MAVVRATILKLLCPKHGDLGFINNISVFQGILGEFLPPLFHRQKGIEKFSSFLKAIQQIS